MKKQHTQRVNWWMLVLILALISAGCGTPATTPSSTAVTPTAAASPTEVASSTATTSETTATPVVVVDKNVLYKDNFTNSASGWPDEKFDNYFVGYHEPEYYHVEITSPNYKTTVFTPDKQTLDDATIETKAFTVSKKTAATGDFKYGLAFRRSGDNYYAFTISPRTKKWYLFKSSSSALVVLKEGTEASIHDLDTPDILRVDAQGSNFSLYINDQLVGQVADADYATGEVGFFVQTVDAANIHIHFDELTIRKIESPPSMYEDNFTNAASGWPEKKFDNYFIGYHEPEYYHVEITSPNYKTTVFAPNKQKFDSATIELQVFTVPKKTAATGDFRYGLAFRRSGDNYYAFTISPRTKKWSVLKSSPNGVVSLKEGRDDSIHDLGVADLLRVDAQGPNFFFHINDHLVTQVADSDYAAGEVGFFVQTIDAANIHIHFDTLTIRKFEASYTCSVVNNGTLYVRSGPGKTYPEIAVLSGSDTVTALGVSTSREWIQIKAKKESDDLGWISYAEGYLSCTPTLDVFPIVSP